jgi:hypothetical protein
VTDSTEAVNAAMEGEFRLLDPDYREFDAEVAQ